MIRLQIIDLLAEHERPHVLAQELDHVERVGEAGAVAGEAVFVKRQQMIHIPSPSPLHKLVDPPPSLPTHGSDRRTCLHRQPLTLRNELSPSPSSHCPRPRIS